MINGFCVFATIPVDFLTQKLFFIVLYTFRIIKKDAPSVSRRPIFVKEKFSLVFEEPKW